MHDQIGSSARQAALFVGCSSGLTAKVHGLPWCILPVSEFSVHRLAGAPGV
jgi:hypothetical protein